LGWCCLCFRYGSRFLSRDSFWLWTRCSGDRESRHNSPDFSILCNYLGSSLEVLWVWNLNLAVFFADNCKAALVTHMNAIRTPLVLTFFKY